MLFPSVSVVCGLLALSCLGSCSLTRHSLSPTYKSTTTATATSPTRSHTELELISLFSTGRIRMLGLLHNGTHLVALFLSNQTNNNTSLSSEALVYDLPITGLKIDSMNVFGASALSLTEHWPSIGNVTKVINTVDSGQFLGAFAIGGTNIVFVTRIEVPNTFQVTILECNPESGTVSERNYSAAYFPAPISSSFVSSPESGIFYVLEQGNSLSADYHLFKYRLDAAKFSLVLLQRLSMCKLNTADNVSSTHAHIMFIDSKQNPSVSCGNIEWHLYASAFTDGLYFRLFDHRQVYVFEHRAVEQQGTVVRVQFVPYARFVVSIAPSTESHLFTAQSFKVKMSTLTIAIVVLLVIVLLTVSCLWLLYWTKRNKSKQAQLVTTGETYDEDGYLDPYLKSSGAIQADRYFATKSKRNSKSKRRKTKTSKRGKIGKKKTAKKTGSDKFGSPSGASAKNLSKSRTSRATVQAKQTVAAYFARMKQLDHSNKKKKKAPLSPKGKTKSHKPKRPSTKKNKKIIGESVSEDNSTTQKIKLKAVASSQTDARTTVDSSRNNNEINVCKNDQSSAATSSSKNRSKKRMSSKRRKRMSQKKLTTAGSSKRKSTRRVTGSSKMKKAKAARAAKLAAQRVQAGADTSSTSKNTADAFSFSKKSSGKKRNSKRASVAESSSRKQKVKQSVVAKQVSTTADFYPSLMTDLKE